MIKKVLLTSFFISSAVCGFAETANFSDKVLNPFDEWNVYGENHFRYDYYDTHGNDAGSVFPFDSNQAYNETRISMDRQVSLYELVSLSSAFLVNGSEYRAQQEDWGIVEDLRFSWQKGNAAVPFRLDAGDYLANLSYRTIQANLKGIQLELQPPIHLTGEDERHSILLFSGITQRDYSHLDFGDNLSNGGSWLVNLAKWGA